MGDIYDLSEIFILVLCCIFLYMQFGRSARVRVVKKEKAPMKNEIRRQHKKERRLRKIRRRLKISYRGNACIIKYDKTAPYIEYCIKLHLYQTPVPEKCLTIVSGFVPG